MAIPPKEDILSIKIDDTHGERGVLIVGLSGILNTFSSVQLVRILDPEIFTRFHNFVFDYSELNFIDSMGLSAMVTIFKRIESEGGRLCVINVKDSIRTVFEITKVIRKIPVISDLEEAMRILDSPDGDTI